MPRGVVFAIVAAAGATLLELAACSLDTTGSSGAAPADASLDALADATVDASDDVIALDAPSDMTDAGSPDTAPGPDSGPPDCGALLQCGSSCVSSCAACDAGQVLCSATRTCNPDCTACQSFGYGTTCFSCSSGAPFGYCGANPTACPNDLGAGACGCLDGDAGACPAPSMTCTGVAGVCKTCGQGGTNNQACGNGLGCSENTGKCDRDQ